jgi:2-dehydro-3-deoxygalactonokinase
MAALIACDWGSTTLRAWTLDAAGGVLARRDLPFGVNRLGPGEAAARFGEVRAALGAPDAPAILCGAIGSNLGWRTAPYADCPAGLADIARGLVEAEAGVWIAPGLRCEGLEGACDVLRGEETMALGWVAGSPDRRRGRYLVCQPGTHSKWLVIEGGRVTRFLSAFTGELYAVLTQHSILRGAPRATTVAAFDQAAFDAGTAAAGEGDALLTRLYTARSRVAGGGAAMETTAPYLSGLLIGAEVAATPRLLGLEREPVVLLGDAAACARYARALGRRGTATRFADGEVAVLGGLTELARLGGPA